MCGIIGYVGERPCRELILEGLRKLEYRGYDSAGLSLLTDGSVDSVHAVGNLKHLQEAVASRDGDFQGSTGIGHTRWATHGRVTYENAHPHCDTSNRVHIVLNGIVENWSELKRRLESEGAEFTSETDAEVVAHLIAHHLDGDLVEAVRAAYNEQPDAVAETVADRLVGDEVRLGDIGVSDDELANLRRVIVVACGTSYHAGLTGRYAIESWARVPVEMDIASEFRYRNPVIDERDLVIGISQSGETADTLAAMRLARERGAKVLAITNIMGSQATRDSDGVLFTRAGLEIGVAATKTFVAQVAAMYMLALKLAALRGTLEHQVLRRLVGELREMPHSIEGPLADVDEPVRQIS